MGQLWIPGARRRAPHAQGSPMAGGPPRMVHHITYDKLGAHGERPSLDAIARYLTGAHYEPHVIADPFTGRLDQWLPANRSAYALRNASGGVETNRMGTVCLQVEWLFTPGTVYQGKGYVTLADTPMRGLEEVLAWADSWDIPRVWPMGAPTWRSRRDARTWRSKAGHYGHSQTPENTHTDPGPMPPLAKHVPSAPPAAKPPAKPRPPAAKPKPKPPAPAPAPTLEGPPPVIIVLDPAGKGDAQYLCDRTGASHITGPERAVLIAAGVPYVGADQASASERRAFLLARGITA